MPYANNKGADQPAHPRRLISSFVSRCLDNVIPLVSIPEIPSLYLASVAGLAGLSLPWSKTPKTGFLVTRLKYKKTNLEVTTPSHVHSDSNEKTFILIFLGFRIYMCDHSVILIL